MTVDLPTVTQRLEAAARLKAILDSSGPFDPRDAETFAALLAGMPASGPSLSWRRESDGRVTERSMGNYELRCGAWVVERWGSSTYDIRHVAADKPEDGYRLRKAKGRWRMDRGYARSITIFGGTMSWIRYRLWKRAAG